MAFDTGGSDERSWRAVFRRSDGCVQPRTELAASAIDLTDEELARLS
ncbi:hypothetical protein [Haloarcula sp. Atlit-47R]|nr:hypothetical protein [Haloarcula sp. Atlit-47R]